MDVMAKYFFWFLLGVLFMVILFGFVLPPVIASVKFFEGDGIRAIRVEKVGVDGIFLLPEDPNDAECYSLNKTLSRKFGARQSAEKVMYEAKVRGIVGWWYGPPEKKD